MYIQPAPVLTAINEMRNRGKGERSLEAKDLSAQMGPEPYWEKNKGKRRVRFGTGSATSYCWTIYLDYHPLGYQKIDDEDYVAWFNQARVNREAQGDPRRGELYGIFDAIGEEESKLPDSEQLGMEQVS